MITKQDYEIAFLEEQASYYQDISDYEKAKGFALDKIRLEDAARVLACPVKKNLPNWQHGRVIYAALRRTLMRPDLDPIICVDVGTAKGFSALCALWALKDAKRIGRVLSADVIDPTSKEPRNTIAEINGYKSLYEILEPWSEHKQIEFLNKTGTALLSQLRDRVQFAFLDGKHTRSTVVMELALLATLQVSDDVVVLDDVQIPGVLQAIQESRRYYNFVYLSSLPIRQYAIGVRI